MRIRQQQKEMTYFSLSVKQPLPGRWSQIGDTFTPPTFPVQAYPAFRNSFSGSCLLRVNNLNKSNAIVFNHLHGTATVNAVGSAIKYSPWSFRGYDASGNPTE